MSAILRAWTSAWLGVALLVLPAWGRAATLTPADYLLDHIQQASYVAEGQGTRLLYIFFDPNCPYCHTLYRNLRPWVGKGGLQVRWIPVGILTSTSEAKAAAILQAPNPLAALRKNEEDYGFSDDAGGGITPATRVGTQAGRQLAANRDPGRHPSRPATGRQRRAAEEPADLRRPRVAVSRSQGTRTVTRWGTGVSGRTEGLARAHHVGRSLA